MGTSNSFKTVREILQEAPALNSYLVDADKYWAHRDMNQRKEAETLEEHVDLVNANLLRLVEAHQLDNVIDNLISKYLFDIGRDNSLGDAIKRQYIMAIYFHDHGKTNENFQASSEKMDNPQFKDFVGRDSFLSTYHAPLSAFIYLADELDRILSEVEDLNQMDLIVTSFTFSYVILKHHSRKLNDEIEAALCLESLLMNRDREEIMDFMYRYLDLFKINLDQKYASAIGERSLVSRCVSYCSKSTAMFGLLKLCYSLLTASDYLATSEYCSDISTTDIGVFSKERIGEIYHNLSAKSFFVNAPDKINFNRDTYLALQDYKLHNPKEQSGENLNILRKEMGVEMLRNLRKNRNEYLFFIEAPTGGGKTNLSTLAAMELLKSSGGKLNKLFYVFPFTTLITQTKASLEKILGLEKDEIVELHSRAAFDEKREYDDLYGKDKLNYIANLFVHYPVCLLSHIAFFDILKTNRKEKNYLFHRLANSVVVIDELQSYNPKHWDKIIYFIRYFAETFNMRFILMSATLPKLDRLVVNDRSESDFVNLIPKARERYFQNPNFCNRVSFDFEYFDRNNLTLEELAQRVLLESKSYAKLCFGAAKPQGSVYSIVEFITKKSAEKFYRIVSEEPFFDHVFLLSGTILEHRRQYIINYLKNEENRAKRVLVVTTQVVEAGVDIDMDLGFKDRSLIDSDEQLAGRINRNVNKKGCKLFLFNYDKEGNIYRGDKRLENTKKSIDSTLYRAILEKKDFDRLYDLVIDKTNRWNNMPFAVNINSYIDLIKNLRFESLDTGFQLIESKNITCFIPMPLPVNIGTLKFFSDKEIDFLAEYEIYPNENKRIEGVQVFDLYLAFIYEKVDFMIQKIRIKILQSILSKFVISLFASKEMEDKITCFSDMEKSEYGYFYVDRWEVFYSEEGGMNAAKFEGVEETQFL